MQSEGSLTDAGGQPRRSQVAQAAGVGARDSPGTVASPPKNPGSPAAPVSGDAMLEKLPVAQRIVVKRALRAASEAHNEVGIIRAELIRTNERLQHSERELSKKSAALVRLSPHAGIYAAGLPDGLAAADVKKPLFEFRSQGRAIYPWVALGIALSAIAAFTFLFAHPGSFPAPGVVIARRLGAGPMPGKAPDSPSIGPSAVVKFREPGRAPVREAFDRLDRALSGIPPSEVERTLRQANQWLEAAGGPPCTVGFAGKKISLLVTSASKEDSPLTASLVRCAQAVEHVME